MLLSLYIHFPFCKQKCLYCDFVSAPCDENKINAYCDALIAEIRSEGEKFRDATVNTVFFGGGTPSVVPANQMEKVLEALRSSFRIAPQAEFTSEANPGTLTPLWLDTMQKGGMNRLSLGIQAAQDEILKSLGRIHSFQQAAEAVQMAKEAGHKNINADLMFALPGQKLSDYTDSIRKVSDLGVTHISAYSLILEEATPLEALVKSGKQRLPDEDTTALMYERGIALLEELGYYRYEISNFAKDGYCCRHNLGYWQGAWYLGLGIAAHSMLPPSAEEAARGVVHIRRENLPDRENYIKASQENNFDLVRQTEPIGINDAMFETVMLSLRTTDGIDEASFLDNYGLRLNRRYPKTVAHLISEGFAEERDGRFFLNTRGLEVQNTLLLRFMNEL